MPGRCRYRFQGTCDGATRKTRLGPLCGLHREFYAPDLREPSGSHKVVRIEDEINTDWLQQMRKMKGRAKRGGK